MSGISCSMPSVTTETNLRSRVAAGEELLMLRGDINWSKEQLAAAWGKHKYDFIWLDSQHSPYSDHHLVSFTGAAEQLGIPVQLRIPHTRDAHKVGRFFDLGVSGALVPEVMLKGDCPGRSRFCLLWSNWPTELGRRKPARVTQ